MGNALQQRSQDINQNQFNANLGLQQRGQDINQNQFNANLGLQQRGQDIGQNQFNANLGLQQRGQDMDYNLGLGGMQLNAYNVANSMLTSSGMMDWMSVNQGANAVNGTNNQSTTTQPGGNWWNDALGGLFTGWALTRG